MIATIGNGGPVPVIVPTQTQATELAHENFNDAQTVGTVQRALLTKGYVDIGEPNGILGQKTIDVILSFRARNDLPLLPVIDSEFLRALEAAPQKALPIQQTEATKAEVAERVAVVKVSQEIINTSWWAKVWSFVIAIPTSLIALVNLILDNLDDAQNVITPIRNLVGDQLSIWIWVVIMLVVASVIGWQANQISKLSKRIEEKAVEGYRQGTIKNDVPKEEA